LLVHELLEQRAGVYDAYKILAEKPVLSAAERQAYADRKAEIERLSDRIARAQELRAVSVATARPVAGQDPLRVPATVETDPYVSEEAAKARGLTTHKGLVVGGIMRMVGRAGQLFVSPRDIASTLYGDNHPITRAISRALVTAVGGSGGFIVPPDYMAEIIELLRPKAVVRGSDPRVIPMPRGTMTLPGQAAPATASYGTETQQIASTQQVLDQIVATFKKLRALVPVSNDLMRYADPAADAFVRDDLVKVLALREDLAFLTGDGSQGSPRGYLSFANGWALNQGGTSGTWLSTADSTAAVNGSPGDPLRGQNGGNFITSNETYNLGTAASELGGLVNKLDSANVPDDRRVWFWNPRSKNYLYNVQNSLGVYVYRDEMNRGTLLGYPFKNSTQIPVNIWDASGTNKDCSFIFLAEMDESMILDSMQLELAVSREGTYVDANGTTWSAFQNDQTLIRAIAEHDFQLRHDSAVAVAQFVRWAPAIS
jgi:HK97 family phage major capsid protein